MLIVSDTHTQAVRGEKPHQIVYIKPGTPFECPDEIALEKIADGRARTATSVDIAKNEPAPAVAVETTEPDEERFDQVLAACLELDGDDKSLFRADGRPKVEAVSKVLAGPVTSEEIDEAWAAIQAS